MPFIYIYLSLTMTGFSPDQTASYFDLEKQTKPNGEIMDVDHQQQLASLMRNARMHQTQHPVKVGFTPFKPCFGCS